MLSRCAKLLVVLLLCCSAHALAGQGCSQCRDTVSQTNPAVQSSYRGAIVLMLSAVSGFSLAAALVFRKMR